MSAVFADTFYFIALLSPTDEAHSCALALTSQFTGRLLTTEWVLTEVADGMVDYRSRRRFVQFYDGLIERADVDIVRSESGLFAEGMQLYQRRLDKEWSLTDCISFIVMERNQISDALTADHHFEQAGFIVRL